MLLGGLIKETKQFSIVGIVAYDRRIGLFPGGSPMIMLIRQVLPRRRSSVDSPDALGASRGRPL